MATTIDWTQIANEAAQQTDTEFATQIASLTRMNITEINTFIEESNISNENVLKVIQEVNNATASNTEKTAAISNIENGVNFLVSLAKKIV